MEKSQSAPAALENYILDNKHYVESNKIGAGSFGTVFRIPSPELARKSNAVKVSESTLAREILQQEWDILKALDHPNIVKVSGNLFVLPTRSLMVMEDIQGNDLLELLTKGYAPSLAVAHISRCTLRALEYIHHNEFIHKDLKAENILVGAPDIRDVSPATIVKLCDFGLACHRKSAGVFDRTGSLDYCAPEVRLAVIQEPSTLDIYSFSVVFYALCHSALPIEVSEMAERGELAFESQYKGGIKNARKRRDNQFSDKHFRRAYKHSSSFSPTRRYSANKLLKLKVFSDNFFRGLVVPNESMDSAESSDNP